MTVPGEFQPVTAEEKAQAEAAREQLYRDLAEAAKRPPRVVHRPERFFGPIGLDDDGDFQPPLTPEEVAAKEAGRRRGGSHTLASGCLFGLAYGDALGAPTEFLTVEQITARWGPTGPRDLTGDPARVTDDTQMTLAVGRALLGAEHAGPEVLAARLRDEFVAWAADPENNRAPGATCLRACANLARGLPWPDATAVGSKGCGANMRVAPVGLVRGYDLPTLAAVAQLQAALTHGHPTALAASELTAYAVRVLRDGAAPADLPALLRERCHTQRDVYHGDWLGPLWQRAGAASPGAFIAHGWQECLDVLDRLDAAWPGYDGTTDPCRATGEGWIAEEALATALLSVLPFTHDPVRALGRAAVTAGDSDSVACLAGALLGATYGMPAWPAPWSGRIEYRDDLARLGAAWD